jgi:4-alpha-glucanotransferase
LICILQLQDILDLDPAITDKDSDKERINIPGTIGSQNWSWRMLLTVEQLKEQKELMQLVASHIKQRKLRKT